MAEQKKESLNSFEDLVKADTPVEYADVDLGGGKSQRIGSIRAEDFIEWQELRETPEGKKVSGAVLVLKSIVDADGTRTGVTTPYQLMNDTERGKVALTQQLKVRTSELLLRGIFKLNGMTPKLEAAAKND